MCPGCDEALSSFTHVTGGHGPAGAEALSHALAEHSRGVAAQIDAAVTAALARRDNRSRARGRPPLTADERGAALDAAVAVLERQFVGGGRRRAAGGSSGVVALLLRLRRGCCTGSALLLVQPADLIERARDEAVRALRASLAQPQGAG